MRRLLVAGLLLILVALSAAFLFAQDTPTEPDELLAERGVHVQPLEVVTESPVQILDIASDSARLNFVGLVPLACTVVYGTTTDFGSASIDQNMNGGAIVEHNPIMIGLEPDTEYFYRVQGSGEDGTLYVGEIGSFRTLPQSDEPVLNLLSPERGATVLGVSSNFGDQPDDGTWGILNAFDGNPNTAWASNGDGDSAWFEVQLGERSHITQIAFWTRLMSDGTSQIFSFTVTTDNGDVYGPFEVDDAEQTHSYDVDFDALTLRFDVVRSSGGNTGAHEIAVYGEPVG
ncbi:MAG: discoidin domain-containing protein [Anaerolineae bacterium]|nr:discoidin domain-containing protein [Anaerolineae bacterium]